MSKRQDLAIAREQLIKSARDIAAKAEAENREFTAEERTAVKNAVDQAKAKSDEIAALDGDAKMIADLNSLGLPVGAAATGGKAGAGQGKTLGERFANADATQQWLKSIAPTGVIPDSYKGFRSPAVEFEMDELRGGKALVTGVSDTSAGALIRPDWLGVLDGLAQFQRPLTIADLVTHGTTTSDQITYARVTGFTNNAAVVPEATSAGTIGDGTGGTVTATAGGRKPESGLALETQTTNVKTIAHWIPATKRSLSDAAQIRTLIDAFLRYGLAEELEDQILLGNGTGENFEGLLTVSGTQGQSWDTDLLTTIRKAKTLVRTVGRATATGIVINPEDNERLDLLRDENGNFYFGGPVQAGGGNPVWGLTRVESEAIPAGTAFVGDFRQAILWDREQAAIQVSDSHSDFFIRNLVAILAEMRAAFGVIRPLAFVEVEVTD